MTTLNILIACSVIAALVAPALRRKLAASDAKRVTLTADGTVVLRPSARLAWSGVLAVGSVAVLMYRGRALPAASATLWVDFAIVAAGIAAIVYRMNYEVRADSQGARLTNMFRKVESFTWDRVARFDLGSKQFEIELHDKRVVKVDRNLCGTSELAKLVLRNVPHERISASARKHLEAIA